MWSDEPRLGMYLSLLALFLSTVRLEMPSSCGLQNPEGIASILVRKARNRCTLVFSPTPRLVYTPKPLYIPAHRKKKRVPEEWQILWGLQIDVKQPGLFTKKKPFTVCRKSPVQLARD
jgi:hypothetical protein